MLGRLFSVKDGPSYDRLSGSVLSTKQLCYPDQPPHISKLVLIHTTSYGPEYVTQSGEITLPATAPTPQDQEWTPLMVRYAAMDVLIPKLAFDSIAAGKNLANIPEERFALARSWQEQVLQFRTHPGSTKKGTAAVLNPTSSHPPSPAAVVTATAPPSLQRTVPHFPLRRAVGVPERDSPRSRQPSETPLSDTPTPRKRTLLRARSLRRLKARQDQAREAPQSSQFGTGSDRLGRRGGSGEVDNLQSADEIDHAPASTGDEIGDGWSGFSSYRHSPSSGWEDGGTANDDRSSSSAARSSITRDLKDSSRWGAAGVRPSLFATSRLSRRARREGSPEWRSSGDDLSAQRTAAIRQAARDAGSAFDRSLRLEASAGVSARTAGVPEGRSTPADERGEEGPLSAGRDQATHLGDSQRWPSSHPVTGSLDSESDTWDDDGRFAHVS